MFQLEDLPDLERPGMFATVERKVAIRSALPSTQAVDENGFLSMNNLDRHAKILEVLVTNECPVMCAHCLAHSGGLMRGDTSRRILRRIVESASADPSVEHILFTGGEPFVVPDLLRFGLELAKKHALIASVNTSGNWATSPEAALCVFQPLAPLLDHVWLSTDSYHQVKIPLSQIRVALKAIIACGVEPTILTNLNAGQFEANRGQLLAPPEVVELADEFGVAFHCWPVIDIGRAEKFKKQVPLQRADQPCGLLNRLNFFPGGAVHACGCGIKKFAPGNPLYLGNMLEHDVPELVRKASRSLFLQAIRAIGPVKLLQLIGAEAVGFRTQCSACFHLNACADAERRVEEALSRRPELLDYITRYRKKSGDVFPGDHLPALTPRGNEIPEEALDGAEK